MIYILCDPKDFIAWIGTAPEAQNVQKRIWYKIIGDEKLLKEVKLRTWGLGRDDIELNIEGIKTLEMRIEAEPTFLILKSKGILKTIFWTDPVIIARDGRIVDLCKEDIYKEFVNYEIKEDVSKDYHEENY